MFRKGFIKPEISIDLIGRRRFWIGIILGFSFAILISYFLNYSREALRLLSFFREPYILSHRDFRLYDLFFAFFSSSFGSGVVVIVWLYGPNQIGRKRYRKMYALTYAWFILIASLSVLTRFGSLIAYLLNGLFGYTKHFDILVDYKILLFTIPAYMYFSQWNAVRLIVKMKNWTWFFLVAYLFTSFYLFQTTKADRNMLNLPYYSHNKERFDYIDNELYKIKRLGYTVKPNTKEILRKRYAEDTYELVGKLKQSFTDTGTVTMDTLILEKIVIHNFNHHNYYYFWDKGYLDKNWPYAFPEEIYYQITKHDIDSPETKILFEILNEQISILSVKYVELEQRKFFTKAELRYYYSRRNILQCTETVQSRMIQVIDKLKTDERYKKFHYLIPDIEISQDFGQQTWYDLGL